MKERPILFSAPMVRAILEGRKTQTRRVVKQRDVEWIDEHQGFRETDNAIRCPYGQPGDRLWVREAWAETRPCGSPWPATMYVYRESDNRTDYGGPWRPSIFMPRRASRITLEVTSVRVERLNDISDQDAAAEGAVGGHGSIPGYGYSATPIEHYRDLWEQINGAGSWAANPWVWVIEFRRVEA